MSCEVLQLYLELYGKETSEVRDRTTESGEPC